IKHFCWFFGVVFFLFATCASAQNIAITNAEIYSLEDNSISKGTLTKGTLTKGTLLVQDGKIAAIGNTEIPSGVKTIDAKGGSITPGIFNAHTYIGIEEVSSIPQTVDKI